MNKSSTRLGSHVTSSRLRHRSQNAAFTLLEIMLVVMLISVLLGAGIYMTRGQLEFGRDTRVAADLSSMGTQLRLYQSMNGFYPTTQQGLEALATKPSQAPAPTRWRLLMDQIPKDPWSMPYIYENPGKHNTDSFDLSSSGPDRLPGTEDDIGNWKIISP